MLSFIGIDSASFIIDASHFFQARQPSWKWHSLTTLILTLELLVPYETSGEANDMLFDAAAAAREMPNLELVEIWNGRAGLAGLFRYLSDTKVYAGAFV